MLNPHTSPRQTSLRGPPPPRCEGGYHSANASPENIPAPIVIVMVRWSLDLSYEDYQNPVAIWKNSNYLPHSVFLEAPALHARCVNYPTVVPSPWSAGRHMVPEHLMILILRKSEHITRRCAPNLLSGFCPHRHPLIFKKKILIIAPVADCTGPVSRLALTPLQNPSYQPLICKTEGSAIRSRYNPSIVNQ